MAESDMVPNPHFEQLRDIQDVHCAHKFFSCVDLESQLKESLLELSSLQLIIKLLYEELMLLQSVCPCLQIQSLGMGSVKIQQCLTHGLRLHLNIYITQINQEVLRFAKHHNQYQLLINIPH